MLTESAKDDFWHADFSNMFISRDIEDIPVSVKDLLNAIKDKPVTQLFLHDNAVGVRVVQRSDLLPFLQANSQLVNINLSNCGLSKESMKLLFEDTLVNSETKLKEIRISQNALSGGEIPLSKYLQTYDSLEMLEIKGCRIQ